MHVLAFRIWNSVWVFKTMRLVLVFSVLAAFLTSAQSFYANSGPVINLDPASFDENVKLDGSVWLIEFFAPWCGHCKNLVPAWEEAASALKGIVHVAAVDADTHKSLAAEYGVQGFPTIKLITAGKSGKRKVVDHKGGRTAKEIVEWALGQAKKIALNRIGVSAGTEKGAGGSAKGKAPPPSGSFYGPGSDVVALTDSNFHAEVTSSDNLWLVEFYAPWCGHCKNLKPEYEQLATEVKGKVKIGAVDCTANQATCQEYGVQGYPTIKFFAAHDNGRPSDFQGGRDSGSMAEFVLAEWRKLQPPPEAKQLVDQHVFEAECTGNEDKPAQKLCFVAFLPHILDSKAAGRLKYIQVLQQLAEKYADRPFSYLWAEGGAQPALEKAVDVGGYGLPAFITLNPREAKYAALREAFDFEHATEFVERLRQGFERVSSVNGGLPELDTTDPWDGGEGAGIQEDEFSLEDLMKEEL